MQSPCGVDPFQISRKKTMEAALELGDKEMNSLGFSILNQEA